MLSFCLVLFNWWKCHFLVIEYYYHTKSWPCWGLERILAQITCLKDVEKSVCFKENLKQHQCWHVDEHCSGVDTVIMVRAYTITSGALMVQEELVKYTPKHMLTRQHLTRSSLQTQWDPTQRRAVWAAFFIQEMKCSHHNWPWDSNSCE